MPTPGEHKTVQARILAYAEAIGWTFVSREEAERQRGFDPEVPPAERAKNRSLFFDDLLDAKVREFNPRYAEAEGALPGQCRHLHTDICGNALSAAAAQVGNSLSRRVVPVSVAGPGTIRQQLVAELQCHLNCHETDVNRP